MKTVAIIQARMGSTRLPGKVMKKLHDKTVLNHVIDRVKHAVSNVIVATSDQQADDVIQIEAINCGAKVFRGSESDVLSRYYYAAKENKADLIVRITSDCPLYDPSLLRDMLGFYNDEDYLSNVIERLYPRGLDTEIFKFSALERAFNEAKENFEREHVTPYINRNPEKFNIRDFPGDVNLSAFRWTLDTEEDWQMISRVYDALYKPGEMFTTQDILDFLQENPEVVAINAHIEQKKI